MVAILATPEIEALLTQANLLHKLQTSLHINTISHKILLSALQANSSSKSLHSTLSKSEIHLSHAAAVSAHTPPPTNPQLTLRLAGLRARQQDAAYAEMVRDVTRGATAERESVRLGRLAPQLSLGANVIVTMATCFVAGYFVMKGTSGSESVGLVGGVTGMIVAMGVEAGLLVSKLYGIEKAAERGRKKREREIGRGMDG